MSEGGHWDGTRCPRCRAECLSQTIDGVTYRWCSYVGPPACTYGIDSDVVVENAA